MRLFAAIAAAGHGRGGPALGAPHHPGPALPAQKRDAGALPAAGAHGGPAGRAAGVLAAGGPGGVCAPARRRAVRKNKAMPGDVRIAHVPRWVIANGIAGRYIDRHSGKTAPGCEIPAWDSLPWGERRSPAVWGPPRCERPERSGEGPLSCQVLSPGHGLLASSMVIPPEKWPPQETEYVPMTWCSLSYRES